MSTETRVMAPKGKIGMRPPGAGAPQPPAQAPEPEQPKRKGGRLPSVIIGLLIVVLAAGAYWFLAGPGASTDAAEGAEAEVEEHHELGDVQIVESVSLNLEGGHYLRIGLGLQLGADAHGEVDEAKALDAAIALFSGLNQDELMEEAVRAHLKEELAHELEELYEGEVLGVYYTDFVTQ
ncbi:flagellar basal body-associated FliL family protein [Demequina mangrovi]|uniref:Flagellar protein FliL n=1 Tax=Demequina mangrovi TaxID=1043493 RepID=A0A1H7A1Y7_9MICO|nr:flagellar basal body-associated FliL family protein [Demequina mangrovi]SEJ56032.1 flagellar FliL protein [Demequina mangrovi]